MTKIDLQKLNERMDYYDIELTSGAANEPVIFEDGEYHCRPGYRVVNRQTGVVEHTSALLPSVIFQAQHLDSMLGELLDPKPLQQSLANMVVDEDVVAN